MSYQCTIFCRGRSPFLRFCFNSSRNIVPFPYVIISFIKGVTLDEYMRKHECYPTKLITQIAEGLAQIHSTTFERAALLDRNFNYKKDIVLWVRFKINCSLTNSSTASSKDRLGPSNSGSLFSFWPSLFLWRIELPPSVKK